MNIIFYGAKQAGMVSLLTLMASKENIICVIPNDDLIEIVAKELKLKIFKPELLNTADSTEYMKKLKPDLFICCHGREILKKDILDIPRFGCINLHPCLYKYKGPRPIDKLLKDKEIKASVAVHYMTGIVDQGKTIVEKFVDVTGCGTEEEVYNKLYLYYSLTLLNALEKIRNKKNEKRR